MLSSETRHRIYGRVIRIVWNNRKSYCFKFAEKKWKFASKKNLETEIMNKSYSPTEEKDYRKKRYKSDEHLRLGDLESDLDRAQQRVHFYQYSLSIIDDLAKELTGVDLKKKLDKSCLLTHIQNIAIYSIVTRGHLIFFIQSLK